MTIKSLRKVIVWLALGALLGACAPLENALDCKGICTRYRTCFDSNYDVDACQARCRDNANSNDKYESDVRICEDCIDDKSCASATFNCSVQCNTVVP